MRPGAVSGWRIIASALAVILGACLVAAGCTGGSEHRAAATTSPPTPTSTRTASSTPSPSPSPPAARTRLPVDGIRRLVVGLPRTRFRAGTIVMLRGVFTARSPTQVLQAAQIRCTGAGQPTAASTYTTRNTPSSSHLPSVVRVRWLFRAPVDGSYRCGLYGHAKKQRPGRLSIDVVPPPATRIVAVDERLAGALQWPVPRDLQVAPKGEVTLFRHGFEVVPDSTRMRLETAVEITNNYEGRVYEYEVTARLRLAVEQLDASGHACGQSWTAEAEQRVSRETHHDKIMVVLDEVPVRTEDGCTRRFTAAATVADVSGSPITVHGPAYSDTSVEML